MASTPYSQAIGPRSVETLSLACLKRSAEDEDLQQKVGGSVAADAGTVPAMQQDGPERPFQNEYWDNKVPGLYVDVVSGEPQVSSVDRSEKHTSELQSLMRISYAVSCLKKKNNSTLHK